MKPVYRLHCLLTFLFASMFAMSGQLMAQNAPVQPGPGRFFVAPNGNDQWTGKLLSPNPGRTDGPFATLGRGQLIMRKERLKSTLYVRGGTYYLQEPLVLTPEDSGTHYEAYPGEHPVISGGRPITGWRQYTNTIMVAPVPEARSGQWFFGQLWMGKEQQIRARYPNFDPASPYTNGWNYTVYTGPRAGAFGAVLSRIQNTNDWIEWTVDVPLDGDYKVAFYYAALNAVNGYRDLSGRMTLQVGGLQPVLLQNLPDSPSYRWSTVATLSLTKGQQTLRWTNVKGGAMNLDALAISDDPAWFPNGPQLPPVAQGRSRFIIQAESFSNAQCKEMVVPQTGIPLSRSRFEFKAGDLKAYPRSPEPEINIFGGTGAGNSILQVKSIDLTKRTVDVFENMNAIQEIRPGNRYFIANVFEELDAPGEWYLDKAGGALYFWPPRMDLQNQPPVAPVLEKLIEFHGDGAKNQWVEQISFTGFEFSHTTYSRGVPATGPTDAAIILSGAKKCILERNRFINLGGYAVRLENRSTENEIAGNEIAQTGEGGVLFAGTAESQCVSNLVAGNWMHHLGQVYKFVAGVNCMTASGNRIAYNRFEYLPRAAVSLKTLDVNNFSHANVVEYNDIQFTGMETLDMGAIETYGRDQKDSGNVIRFNRILDTYGAGSGTDGKLISPSYSWGVYLADYSSGTTVYGNVIARTDQGAICVQGGRNNQISNNILLEGASHQITYQLVDNFASSNRFTTNIVYFTSQKADLFNFVGTWRSQSVKESNFNIYWNQQGTNFFRTHPVSPYGVFAKWQSATFDRESQLVDPMFSEPNRDDYRLRNGSPALKLGFQPIPFDSIGLPGFARAWQIKR